MPESKLYTVLPRQDHHRLLLELSQAGGTGASFSDSSRLCYLSYLGKNDKLRPEEADIILAFSSIPLRLESIARPIHQNISFFWKNGEFGRLVPTPVMSSRFQLENHLNDPLSRSLGNQLKIALTEPNSAFGDSYYISSLLFTLAKHLLLLEQTYRKSQLYNQYKITPRQFSQVKTYIRNRLGEKIRISDMARVIGLSEGYFYEVFKHTTGTTPHEFITITKIERARELLLKSSESVIQIGMALGYDNPGYFGKVFKKLTGSSPSQFREQYSKSRRSSEKQVYGS